ncbi:C2H2 transcription factor [Histoplasma capsulatum H143]|uniref:C2H2 transcription factor n=1 Tax=Ajellomyces capsulatus (strain H143) TaxID=544712 RepID=C6HCH9_AJECH|nr:C2H2 transcription factor [Histoplasma capsulatum H143]
MSHGEGTYPDVDKWMDDYLRFDDRVDFSDHSSTPMGVPKLTRTISDIYQDELYNPNASTTPKPSMQFSTQNAKMYSPYHRNIITDRIQAAHQGHISDQSQSRSTSAARHRSPWRDNSPFLHEQAAFNDAQMSQSQPFPDQLNLAAQQQSNMLMGPAQPEPKTISPKDALLEYNESPDDANMSLFPSQPEASQYRVSPMGNSATFHIPHMEQYANQYDQHKNNMPQQFGYIHQQQIPLQLSGQQQHQHQPQPSQPQQRQQARRAHPPQGQRENNLVHHTPEFPRQLPSMDSTSSDTNTSASNRSPLRAAPTSNPTGEPAKRPDDTSSDGGTYSCTYHGCILRFETPAKLQKHKREAHRQTTPGSHAMSTLFFKEKRRKTKQDAIPHSILSTTCAAISIQAYASERKAPRKAYVMQCIMCCARCFSVRKPARPRKPETSKKQNKLETELRHDDASRQEDPSTLVSNSGDQSRCTRFRDLAAQSDGSNWHYQIPIRDLSAYKTGTFLGPTLPERGRCPPICVTVTSFMPRLEAGPAHLCSVSLDRGLSARPGPNRLAQPYVAAVLRVFSFRFYHCLGFYGERTTTSFNSFLHFMKQRKRQSLDD